MDVSSQPQTNLTRLFTDFDLKLWCWFSRDLPPEKVSKSCVRLGKNKGGNMVKKGYTTEQITNKCWEADNYSIRMAPLP